MLFRSRLEGDALDQGGLQGDGEVVKGLQDADQGVDGSPLPQQSGVLIHPLDQGTFHQQGEPLRQ